MAESFDPYYTWLGIPPEEQPADHYRLLGVRRFEANEEVLINASDQRMAYVRTFQTGKRSKESQALLNEISAAQVCLLNPEKKRAYDEELRRKLGQTSTSQPATKPAATQPAARTTPAPARTLPVASPLRPSATPTQPLDLRAQSPQPQVVTQRRAPAAAAAPLSLAELDPLASAQLTTGPLRPVVAPKDGAMWTPRMLIIAGSTAGALIVLLGVVVWAATRPGPRPVANVPVNENNPPSITRGNPPPPPPAPRPTPAPGPATPSEPLVIPPVANPTPAGSSASPMPPVVETIPASSSSIPSTAPAATPVENPPAEPSPPPTPAVGSAAAVGPRPISSRELILARLLTFGVDHRQLVFSRSGDHLAAFGADRNHACVSRMVGDTRTEGRPAHFIAFADDDSAFLRLEPDNKIAVHRLGEQSSAREGTIEPGGTVIQARFTPDGKFIVALLGGPAPRLVSYESATHKPMDLVQTSLAKTSWFDIRGEWLVCWSRDERAEAISLRDPSKRQQLKDAVEFPPFLLEADDAGASMWALHRVNSDRVSIYRWNLAAGGSREFHLEGLRTPADLLSASHDGTLVALRRGESVAIIRVLDGSELTRIEFPLGHPVAAALTADDHKLAFNGPGGEVWVANLKQLRTKPSWHMVVRDGRTSLESPDAEANRPKRTLAKSSDPPPVVSREAGRAAIAALRAAGVEVPDDPQQVHSIRTGGTQFKAQHAPLLAQLGSLQSLFLGGTPEAPTILKALPESPVLQVMELSNTPIGDDDLEQLQKFPALTYLNVQSTAIKGPGLNHLRCLERLETLSLSWDLPREAIPHIAGLVQLTSVSNWPQGITNDDLAQLARMEKLTSIDLQRAQITTAGLKHLGNLRNLQSLELPAGLPAGSLAGIADLRLTWFTIPRDTPEEDLVHLARMPSLQRVSLPDTTTDGALKHLAASPALQKIQMRPCRKITDSGLRDLAASRTIVEVDLPDHIGDEGVAHLAAMPQLEKISVLGSAVSDQGITALRSLPKLKYLWIGGGLTDAGAQVLSEFPALEQLTVNDAKLTSKAFESLRSIKSLQGINIMRVPIDDEGVAALSKMKQLKHIAIQFFKLTPEQLETLKRSLPECQIHNSGRN